MRVATPNDKVTLLLNNAWQPINAITARASFMHLYKSRIVALDRHANLFHTLDTWEGLAEFYPDQPVMRSSSDMWRIPTLVVVTSRFFVKPKKKKLSLGDLSRIYKNTCQYCLKQYKIKYLTVDHIHPKSLGGSDDHENRTLACKKCNSHKGSIIPYHDKHGRLVKAPTIPDVILNTHDIRPEWEPFLKGVLR